jgi:hypothetical protein
VEVCKPGFLEPNCRLYGSTWKPTGLIQNNADRMRFGVFGYLLDMDRARAGGVMRAKIKDVGPMTIDPVNPPVANPRAEFSSSNGTLNLNPDSADATASGVSQSGVINYLNQFGKSSLNYKSGDTLAEMYYESLRYLKNMGSATPQYVAGLTTAMKDGFPVITTWDDPVKYSCQRNYALMIADVNAWCDYALPGTSITGDNNCKTGSGPVHSSTISNPIPGLNVTTQINRVAVLDNSVKWQSTGYGNLATVLAPIKHPVTNNSNNRGNTWYLAGLAYWANTTNVRPDLTGAFSSERVTVQTYTVDVAESGSWYVNNVSGQPINQLWLAAKYGGFNDVNFDGVPANQQSWDKDGNSTPDNYFLASRPDKIGASLSSVFNDVLSKTEAAVGATLISSQVQDGDSVYQVQYSSNGWVGDVFASTITFDALGNPSTAPSWSARPLLDSLVLSGGWSTPARSRPERHDRSPVPDRQPRHHGRATKRPGAHCGHPAGGAQLPPRRPLEGRCPLSHPHRDTRRHRKRRGRGGRRAASAVRRGHEPGLHRLQGGEGRAPEDGVCGVERRHAPRVQRSHSGWRAGALRLRPELRLQRPELAGDANDRRARGARPGRISAPLLHRLDTRRGRRGLRAHRRESLHRPVADGDPRLAHDPGRRPGQGRQGLLCPGYHRSGRHGDVGDRARREGVVGVHRSGHGFHLRQAGHREAPAVRLGGDGCLGLQ